MKMISAGKLINSRTFISGSGMTAPIATFTAILRSRLSACGFLLLYVIRRHAVKQKVLHRTSYKRARRHPPDRACRHPAKAAQGEAGDLRSRAHRQDQDA